ncbi:MAG TPA: ABC transporter substrate-binding protein, partial [Campylobacterales bacterium]|nr:ABC transporter substrate-binding protein [Campylobacterales bacterium]
SKIKKDGQIRVCIWPEYYAISYVDQRTQKLSGIDVDLAMQLAKDLGVELKFVKSSFATLIEDVTSDKCDIAMFAIGHTPARAAKIRLTTPHLASDIYAVTTKSNRRIKNWGDIDKSGVVVAVAKGTYHEAVMKSKLKNASLMVVENLHAREQEVESGRADVFMTDYPFGMRMLSQTSWARLVKPESLYHLTPYGWAVAYGDDAFYQRVEKFIADIKKDGRLKKAAKDNALEPIVNLK